MRVGVGHTDPTRINYLQKIKPKSRKVENMSLPRTNKLKVKYIAVRF